MIGKHTIHGIWHRTSPTHPPHSVNSLGLATYQIPRTEIIIFMTCCFCRSVDLSFPGSDVTDYKSLLLSFPGLSLHYTSLPPRYYHTSIPLPHNFYSTLQTSNQTNYKKTIENAPQIPLRAPPPLRPLHPRRRRRGRHQQRHHRR